MLKSGSIDIGKSYFGPAGVCIYCGLNGKETRLSDEHIIPAGLGGDWQLENASCSECARITQIIEKHCASKIYGDFLVLKDISRRNKKNRPKIVKISFTFLEGDITIDVPVEDAVAILFLPVMSAPRICEHSTDRNGLNVKGIWQWVPSDISERAARMAPPNALGFRYNSSGNYSQFSRLLAKIALAGAVAFFGYDPARSLLGKILTTGSDDELGYYVGGCELIPLKADTDMNFTKVDGSDKHVLAYGKGTNSKGYFLICILQLFKGHKTPAYFITVGPLDRNEEIIETTPRVARSRRKPL